MQPLRPETPAGMPRAYVTLVTGDAYAKGAVALANSIRLAGCQADIAVLHTADVSPGALEMLRKAGARLICAEPLPVSEAFELAHGREELHRAAPFLKGGKPSFHNPLDNFIKLRLWQLTEYERCVFIDADAVVLRNTDRLFGYPEFSAAPNVYESLKDFHRLNSGVFVARPSLDTFAAMMKRLDQPGAFWRRTDQTFLETFFPDWHGLPVFDNMLQYVWFALPDLWDWSAIRILHYQYEKPWQDEHPKRDQLAPLIDLWWAFFNGQRPDIDGLPGPR